MRPIYVLLSCAAVALAIATWVAIGEGGVPRLKELDGERGRLQAETDSLRQENASLRTEAERLRAEGGSTAALEKAAREELGYVKNGEVVVIDDEAGR